MESKDIEGLDPEEREALDRRFGSWRQTMEPLREAAAGEEPLFAPELEERR